MKGKATKTIDAMLSDSDESSSEVVVPKKAVKAKKKVVKPVSDDESSSDDVELLKQKTKRVADTKKATKTSDLPKAAKKAAKKQESSDDESSSEVVAPKKVAKKAPVKKQESSDDESSEVVAPKKVAKKAPVKKQESSDEESDDESSEVVAPKKVAKKAPAKKQESSDEESDDESSEEVQQVKQTPKPVPAQNESDCMELFVKNLGWKTEENSLGSFFGTYGDVQSVKILYDKQTGRSKGLAFVGFSSRSEAQAALDDAANLNCDGRLLQVSFSDQKPPRDNNSFGGNQGGFGGNQGGFGGNRGGNYNSGPKHTIFVGNLGFKSTEMSVKKFFQGCGNVMDVRIAKNEEGRSKGFCHVDFDTPEAVETAKGKAGQELDGRELRVDASTPRQGGGAGGRGGFGGGRGGRGGFGGGRGGRGGFGNPMDRAKKSGGIIANPNAVVTFSDDD